MMILPTCQQVSKTLAEATGTIPWHQALLLRLHLAMCGHCAKVAGELRLLGAAFRSYRPDAASVEALQKKILARVRKA